MMLVESIFHQWFAMERTGRFKGDDIFILFLWFRSLGEKGNGMESNDQRRHFLSVLHVIYFMRMGIKSLHILTFARWTFSHMSGVEFSSLHQVNVNTQWAVNIESRPLPAIRDGSLDGWFVYISNKTPAGNAIQLTAGQLLPEQTVQYGKAWTLDSPSRCQVTLIQPVRRAAVSGQISSLPPHWSNKSSYTEINISTVQNRMNMYTLYSTSILPSTGKFLAIGQIQTKGKFFELIS